ncbi:class I SAM-dependent methyltransferase [Tundrisphaera lichenicola]|uniref:class I SAM-dependent methyltransferase n=1 Tax=Tundrisphaera lichenicola TaxID=2029860 RepID=UPI003EBA2BDD
MATVSSLQDEVDAIRWWHSIDLGDGVVTRGGYDTKETLKKVAMPDDLSGWSVLDVGAWDGFYSFEAEKRGASRVVALDHVVWNDPTVGRHGFELARRTLGSKVEDVDCEVHTITPELVGGTYDLVLFLGVLYHVHHPLLALQRVASVCDKMLILETHVDLEETSRPALAYYPGTECANDLSNWFGPNSAAVEAMLKTVGFRTVKRVWSHLDSKQNPVGYKIVGGEKSQFGRAIFHAWK